MTFINIGGPELASHTWTPVLTDTYDPIGFTVRGNNNYYEKRGDLVLAKVWSIHTKYIWQLCRKSIYEDVFASSAEARIWICNMWIVLSIQYKHLIPTDNWSIFGAVVLHDDSQSESTVQFAIYNSMGLSTAFNMIPDGLRHADRYMSINGYMIYEAL